LTLEKIKSKLKKNSAILIYFSSIGCSVCQILQYKIENSFNTIYPLITQYHLNIQKYKDVAIYFNVFSTPTILVFLDGKEFVRKNRNMSIHELILDLKRPYNLLFEETV
jgi:thioredoxin-like negative regulator of GroEL